MTLPLTERRINFLKSFNYGDWKSDWFGWKSDWFGWKSDLVEKVIKLVIKIKINITSAIKIDVRQILKKIQNLASAWVFGQKPDIFQSFWLRPNVKMQLRSFTEFFSIQVDKVTIISFWKYSFLVTIPQKKSLRNASWLGMSKPHYDNQDFPHWPMGFTL